MKVVVTGGAGFIGSHVVEELIGTGATVTVIDDLSCGHRDFIPPHVELIEMDLGRADDARIEEITRAVAPDAIVHLAAIHSIPYCRAHPEETIRTNVRGTLNLTRAATRAGVRSIVLASTLDVYAHSPRPHTESGEIRTDNPYGRSKVLAEEVIETWSRSGAGHSSTALRLANVYGRRETNPHLIPDALARFADPEPPVIQMGNLAACRDFVHVTDVARAFVRAASSPAAGHRVFNIGTGIATSARALVHKLAVAAGEHRPIVESDGLKRSQERWSLTADTTLVGKALGWRPTVSLDDGLADLVAANERAEAP